MSTISRLDPIVHLAATRTFIGWLCSDPNNVKLLEEVGDSPIDYATLTLSHPSITCVMDKEDPNVFNHLAYTAGRWNFIMKLDEYPSWKNRFMNSFGPDDVEFTIHVNLDGLWLAKKQLNYNTTTDSITLDKQFAPDIMEQILKPFRTRVANIVRGYETYLKEPARYDNLRQLLKIKTRKKK